MYKRTIKGHKDLNMIFYINLPRFVWWDKSRWHAWHPEWLSWTPRCWWPEWSSGNPPDTSRRSDCAPPRESSSGSAGSAVDSRDSPATKTVILSIQPQSKSYRILLMDGAVLDSVANPDPYVYGLPKSGFGSISQRYGSGSFYHQAKIVRKTFISTH
jgi:hypothetical protein